MAAGEAIPRRGATVNGHVLHCRHCSDCASEWEHENGYGAAWNAGDCPACAEEPTDRRPIEKEFADTYSPGDDYMYGLAAAAKIARGET